MEAEAGKKVLKGLVGDYASDSTGEEDIDVDAEGEPEGLTGLMQYESEAEDEDAGVLWDSWQTTNANHLDATESQSDGAANDDSDRISWGDEDEEPALAALAARGGT